MLIKFNLTHERLGRESQIRWKPWDTEFCLLSEQTYLFQLVNAAQIVSKKGWDNTKLSSNLDYIFGHVFHNLLLITLRFITYILASDSSNFKNKANKTTKCCNSAIVPKTIFLVHGRDWHRNVTQEENIINMKKSYNFWSMLACLGSNFLSYICIAYSDKYI